MGKTFDTLFGRTTKLITLLHDSITRISILKNRHSSLLTFTSSDIVDLLELGHVKQAILRVEHVIKSKNMLDTLSIIETYCHILVQRVSEIERNKNLPEDELKEAIATLIFASTRIGEFPELQHIRDYFSAKFGKEYVTHCIEFPLYSSVNDKVVQNLSTRKPSFETRMRIISEMASKNGIELRLDLDFRHGEEKAKPSKLSRNTLTINQALTKGG